jgi:hypothetical protein
MDSDGIAVPSFTAAIADGHSLVNEGKKTFIYVKNTDGSAHDVEIQIQQTVDGETVPSKTVSVPATTGERLIGPFDRGPYNIAGVIYIDFPVQTGMSVAGLKIGD